MKGASFFFSKGGGGMFIDIKWLGVCVYIGNQSKVQYGEGIGV